MLRCIWNILEMLVLCSSHEGGVDLTLGTSTHCTIRMSTFSTEDLFDACEKGDIARVRQAVADGVDVRKVVDKNWYNRTPLHYACRYVVVRFGPRPPPSSKGLGIVYSICMPICHKKGCLAYAPIDVMPHLPHPGQMWGIRWPLVLD